MNPNENATISRWDVARGLVPPKVIDNGVVVKPALQINAETLQEHRDRMAQQGYSPLKEWEERALFANELAA